MSVRRNLVIRARIDITPLTKGMNDKLTIELSQEEKEYLSELLNNQENYWSKGAWKLLDRLKEMVKEGEHELKMTQE